MQKIPSRMWENSMTGILIGERLITLSERAIRPANRFRSGLRISCDTLLVPPSKKQKVWTRHKHCWDTRRRTRPSGMHMGSWPLPHKWQGNGKIPLPTCRKRASRRNQQSEQRQTSLKTVVSTEIRVFCEGRAVSIPGI